MKKGYIVHLEEETLNNGDYRRVLYTAEGTQLVLMSLLPGVEIGEETHHLDQFIRIDQGEATVVLDGEKHTLTDGDAVIIPRGVKHNVVNSGTESVKLYSLYSPPEHRDGTIHRTKADEKEEHFDGKTTE
jgi:mannose-6-phosphate isomerase-like protein (cupin superfamily)